MRSANPLSILFVGTFVPHPGGSAIHATQLLPALAGMGHQIHVVASVTSETEDRRRDQRYHPLEFTRYTIPYFETSHAGFGVPKQLREQQRRQLVEILTSLLNRRRFDLVWIGRESLLDAALPIAQSHKLPVIACFHRGRAPNDRAVRVGRSAEGVDCKVTMSQFVRNTMAAVGVHDLCVIPNFVDTERFTPRAKDEALMRSLRISSDAIVVGHFSNLKSVKRPMDVLRSALRTLPQDDRLRFLVGGDGECRREMEAFCVEHNLRTVHFAGWIEHDEMHRYLNVADLVLLPSEVENQPFIGLETLASGRVLIASDIPAHREIVTDGTTGLLHQLGDIEHLSEQILRVAGDAELRAAIGQRARAHARDHDITAIVQQYEECLQRTVRT